MSGERAPTILEEWTEDEVRRMWRRWWRNREKSAKWAAIERQEAEISGRKVDVHNYVEKPLTTDKT